jgi:ADP-ribose pyrophosphatase
MSDTGPLEDVPEHPRILERRTLHDGRVWDVLTETFQYNGSAITREVVDHPGAVAVLALDDEGRVLLIRQYRHPVRSRDWEIPAGLLDVDEEPPLEAAQRELAEEADLKADRWDVLADFMNSPGGSNEMIRVYLARDVSEVPAFERSDEEADIEVRWVPLDEVVDAVLARRVQSPSLAIGVLAAVAARARDWSTLAPADTPWVRHPRVGEPPWTLPPEDPAADRPAE